MQRVIGIISLLCIVLLLAFSDAALEAARSALFIWWNAVLPSLFPFYVLIGLLQQGGSLRLMYSIAGKVFRRNRALQAAVPSFFLGALSGFPTGARVCAMLGQSDLAAYCNLCSPIFLLGVISVNLANNIRLFFPICIAHYASAALTLLLLLPFRKTNHPGVHCEMSPSAPGDVLGCISAGVSAMLRIGGCIVFFSVCSALLNQTGVFPFIARLLEYIGVSKRIGLPLLTGLLEMTAGCAAIAEAALPFRVSAALYASCVSFGGLCIFTQAKMEADTLRPARYLILKAVQAVLAGVTAFLLVPLFVPESIDVMQLPSADIMITNTASGLSLLIASLIGVFGTYVITICMHQIKKAPGIAPRCFCHK